MKLFRQVGISYPTVESPSALKRRNKSSASLTTQSDKVRKLFFTSGITFAGIFRTLFVASADEDVRNVLDVSRIAIHRLANVVFDYRYRNFLEHRWKWTIYNNKGISTVFLSSSKALETLPSYNLPQPVTKAVLPMKSSSISGTQTGIMLGWKITGS